MLSRALERLLWREQRARAAVYFPTVGKLVVSPETARAVADGSARSGILALAGTGGFQLEVDPLCPTWTVTHTLRAPWLSLLARLVGQPVSPSATDRALPAFLAGYRARHTARAVVPPPTGVWN